jgi:hypothetical protein
MKIQCGSRTEKKKLMGIHSFAILSHYRIKTFAVEATSSQAYCPSVIV